MLTRGTAPSACVTNFPAGRASSSSSLPDFAGAGDGGPDGKVCSSGPPAGGGDRKDPRCRPHLRCRTLAAAAAAAAAPAYEEVPAQTRYVSQSDVPDADLRAVGRVEVFFDKPVSPSHMYLKNHYVHAIDIHALVDCIETQWKTLVEDKPLTASAHHDAGGQDGHLLDLKCLFESAEISRVLALRILLKQPSPVHKTVGVAGCKFFAPSCSTAVSTSAGLPSAYGPRTPAIGILETKGYHIMSILAE